jgi:hypothetical protein
MASQVLVGESQQQPRHIVRYRAAARLTGRWLAELLAAQLRDGLFEGGQPRFDCQTHTRARRGFRPEHRISLHRQRYRHRRRRRQSLLQRREFLSERFDTRAQCDRLCWLTVEVDLCSLPREHRPTDESEPEASKQGERLGVANGHSARFDQLGVGCIPDPQQARRRDVTSRATSC